MPKLPRLFLTIEYKTNVMGTLNMLGLSKRIGARFLLTSTSEVYGDPLEHPQKETYWGNVNPIGERHKNLYLVYRSCLALIFVKVLLFDCLFNIVLICFSLHRC